MPTRQATPGSSAAAIAAAQQTLSMNAKKRPSTELEENVDLDLHRRDKPVKKSKKEKDNNNNNNNSGGGSNRDNKKARRRKRRKSSIVATTAIVDSRHMSNSRKANVTVEAVPESVATLSITNPEVPSTVEMEDSVALEDAVHPGSPVDKGKGKAGDESGDSVHESSDSTKAEIERLKRELEAQSLLLRKHQTHLTQMQQALTCQICLDLLHKPFALAPCGHVACYNCLVRWFTADDPAHPLEDRIPRVQPHSHISKKKTCPICRTHVMKRPAELWSIKSMVGNLVKSGLVDLPAPAPENEASNEASASTSAPGGRGRNDAGSADPWRNIFCSADRHTFFDFFPPPLPRPPLRPGNEEDAGLEEMGMYDAEDGGIYRCIDCMHEIYAGVCTFCEREYAGHRGIGDDLDEDDVSFAADFTDSDLDDGPVLRNVLNHIMAREGAGLFGGETYMYHDGDGSVVEDEPTDVEEDDVANHGVHWHFGFTAAGPPNGIRVVPSSDEEEGEETAARIEEVEDGEVGVEDEDAYESSFIDDEDDAGAESLLGRSRYDSPPLVAPVSITHHIYDDDDGDGDGDGDEDEDMEFEEDGDDLFFSTYTGRRFQPHGTEAGSGDGQQQGRHIYRVEDSDGDDDVSDRLSSSPEIRELGRRRRLWRS